MAAVSFIGYADRDDDRHRNRGGRDGKGHAGPLPVRRCRRDAARGVLAQARLKVGGDPVEHL
jgi:hypothetical protein